MALLLILATRTSLAQCFNGQIFEAHNHWGGDFINVSDPATGDCIPCEWANIPMPQSGMTHDSVVASQAFVQNVRTDNRSCTLAMLSSGLIDVNVRYGSCDEFVLMEANSTAMMNILLSHKIDIEMKEKQQCGGRTAAMWAVHDDKAPVLMALIHAGVAICTHPNNVFNMKTSGRTRLLREMSAWAPVSPCEPGFHLTEGENCTGLTPCEEGYYCPGYRLRTNQHMPCPAGMYGNHPLQASVLMCRPCPPWRPFSAPASTDVSGCYETEVDKIVVSVVIPKSPSRCSV